MYVICDTSTMLSMFQCIMHHLFLSLYSIAFISAAIAVCYLFLLFYAWIFFGDEVRLDFPQLGFHNTVILKPITTLKFVGRGKCFPLC